MNARTLLLIASLCSVSTAAVAADEHECSESTLRGTFGFTFTGTARTPNGPSQRGGIGYVMDGQGNLVGAITSNADGVVLRRPLVGTYIVEADCTGRSRLTSQMPWMDTRRSIWSLTTMGTSSDRVDSAAGCREPADAHRRIQEKKESKPRWHATARRSLSGTESRFFRISVLSLAPQQDAATKWSSRSLSRSPSLVLDEPPARTDLPLATDRYLGEEACCTITSRWGTSRSTPGGIHRSQGAGVP